MDRLVPVVCLLVSLIPVVSVVSVILTKEESALIVPVISSEARNLALSVESIHAPSFPPFSQ